MHKARAAAKHARAARDTADAVKGQGEVLAEIREALARLESKVDGLLEPRGAGEPAGATDGGAAARLQLAQDATREHNAGSKPGGVKK